MLPRRTIETRMQNGDVIVETNEKIHPVDQEDTVVGTVAGKPWAAAALPAFSANRTCWQP